jgi:hypothetical protein
MLDSARRSHRTRAGAVPPRLGQIGAQLAANVSPGLGHELMAAMDARQAVALVGMRKPMIIIGVRDTSGRTQPHDGAPVPDTLDTAATASAVRYRETAARTGPWKAVLAH